MMDIMMKTRDLVGLDIKKLYMKRTIIIAWALVALFATASCSNKNSTLVDGIADIEQDEWAYDQDSYSGDEVYVCTGGSSKRYHCTIKCKGLESCKGDIRKVDQRIAEGKGRTPCRWCYDKK